MFSSVELKELSDLAEASVANYYLKFKLASFANIMKVVEAKGKELYQKYQPKLDSCFTGVHKIWVMESNFGSSIHLEAFGEHWSFWENDSGEGIISHKHPM